MDRFALEEQLWALRVPMLRLAASILRHPQNAEDAVSEAMLIAFRRIGTLRDEKAFRPWMLRITANCCYDLLRREKRQRDLSGQMDSLALFEQAQDTLLEEIARLPRAMAQVLVLYYYEHFSTAEIAQILHIPGATVRMRLARGRRQLKTLLEKEEAEWNEPQSSRI